MNLTTVFLVLMIASIVVYDTKAFKWMGKEVPMIFGCLAVIVELYKVLMEIGGTL